MPSRSVGPFWPADVARVQVGPGLAYWTVLSGLTLEPVRPVNHDLTRIPCSWFGARFAGSGGTLSRGLMLLPLPWLSERCPVPANPAQAPMSGTVRAPSSLRLDPRDDGQRLRRSARRSERAS